MFAGFSPNKSKALVVEATQARVLRQNLIASNISTRHFTAQKMWIFKPLL